MGRFRIGNVCIVCGENDAYLDHNHPHEDFCEHCYETLDTWFDEISSDLRTSTKALRGREATEDDVMMALHAYLWERERIEYERSKNGKKR